jgi:hypothetical protein
MKQVLMFVLTGASCLVAAVAVTVGQPAYAEIAVAQAASQPLPESVLLPGLAWDE